MLDLLLEEIWIWCIKREDLLKMDSVEFEVTSCKLNVERKEINDWVGSGLHSHLSLLQRTFEAPPLIRDDFGES